MVKWFSAWARLIRNGWRIRWRAGLAFGLLIACLMSFCDASGYCTDGYIGRMAPLSEVAWTVPLYVAIGFLLTVLAPWRWSFE